jgi:hypothetical protein
MYFPNGAIQKLCSGSVVVTGNAGGGIHHRLPANFEGDWRAQPVWRTSCIVLQFRTHDVLAVALTIPVVVCWTTMGAISQVVWQFAAWALLATQVAGDGRP